MNICVMDYSNGEVTIISNVKLRSEEKIEEFLSDKFGGLSNIEWMCSKKIMKINYEG
jgi:hypothetical protein